MESLQHQLHNILFFFALQDIFTKASTFKYIIQGRPPEFTSYKHGCKLK